MFSVTEQIELFADDNYNATVAVQQFFASKNENEINRKINEMSKIQVEVYFYFL